MNVSLTEILTKLNNIMISDKLIIEHYLQYAIKNCYKENNKQNWIEKISSIIHRSHKRVLYRRASVPIINYSENLSITKEREIILNTIKAHQVVIISGETSSGKSTQLPKICLELGRGITGMIGHTQPRRIAAHSIANRIAEELGSTIGNIIGYKVRFREQVNDNTLIKLMTDGILLTEIKYDRLLSSYDTLIIDEAHERTLNIDFILGYLHQLLPMRPDLKIIIMSATINLTSFSHHFHNAPVIEIPGRQYPIEVRYRPLKKDKYNEVDQIQGIINAIDELNKEDNGDILIFMSSEREIHNTASALTKLVLFKTEILLLYSRLSYEQQNKVFLPIKGKKRIILTTNVAETSLTVPGIAYVIDSGTARISRYNFRTKVQRLPIEPISQASANQRKGRCGRISKGICIRLYSEQDFINRPKFTEPEIMRTHLSSIILQMLALKLGDITTFPFIDIPNHRRIQDGIQLLEELGAITKENKEYHLNSLGKQLSQLPLDPRLSRMIIAANENNALKEIIILVSVLSIQDPRERPMNNENIAHEKHKRFIHQASDFITLINIWEYLQIQQKSMSSKNFRHQCRTNFFNYLNICEWQDIYTQLHQTIILLGMTINTKPSSYKSLHCSLLTGLLSHVGCKKIDTQEYLGAYNIHFNIHPKSSLVKKKYKWIMVVELIETNRLWGCIAARIEPNWIETAGKHIIKYSYSDPFWDKVTGTVIAMEKITLFGLPIIVNRKINYTLVDSKLCRKLFIYHALIAGDWCTKHKFFYENMQLKNQIKMLEHKLRKNNILIDDKELFRFYDKHIDNKITSQKTFNVWWEQIKQKQPKKLNFNYSMLITKCNYTINQLDYPDYWNFNNINLKLSYHFDPSSVTDGVSVHIPLLLLNQIPTNEFEWQIPGFRRDLIISLIKSLNLRLRRNFIPVSDYAEKFLKQVKVKSNSLLSSLEDSLKYMTNVTITHQDWQWHKVPCYLKFNFIIVDSQNNALAKGKNLNQLKLQLHNDIIHTLTSVISKNLYFQNIKYYNFDNDFPKQLKIKYGIHEIILWPAMIDNQKNILIKIFSTQKEQEHAMWCGIRRLLFLNLSILTKSLYKKLFKYCPLTMYYNPYNTSLELINDCILCTIDKLMLEYGGLVWTKNSYIQLKKYVSVYLNSSIIQLSDIVEQILKKTLIINQRIINRSESNLQVSLCDIKNQCDNLIYQGFIINSKWEQLPNILRYLYAIEIRLDKLFVNPYRDYTLMITIKDIYQIWQQFLKTLPVIRRYDNDILEIQWMIEELRVNCFVQSLKIKKTISLENIQMAINNIIL